MGELQGSVLLSEFLHSPSASGSEKPVHFTEYTFQEFRLYTNKCKCIRDQTKCPQYRRWLLLGVSSGQGFHCTSILLVHRIRNYTVSKIEHIMYVCGSKNSTDKMTALLAVFIPGLL